MTASPYIRIPRGALPPCTYPSGERAPNGRPLPCRTPALYGFRVEGWPPGRKAPVCAAHAITVRTLRRVESIWLVTQPMPRRVHSPPSVRPPTFRA